MSYYPVSVYGAIPSLNVTYVDTVSNPPQLAVKSYAPYKRFAVEIVDDGLDTAGLRTGDYAVFREQGWPNDELQVVCVAFGNDMTLRILEGIQIREPFLRTARDVIREQRHRNDFIVLGVLDGIIKADFVEFLEVEEEAFDWGC
ncbi:hypothetical protein [Alicyclobacillus fastidiosus]|uniref:Uncharacterized protein n=1 Tax=Alicyclobacillus fastidiosus TaxID=392011 RepID=A0ABV5A9T6_9BACL|nr:hypothetical protein [Alicyclobacillus fastidiosus]WEH10945.1 hypothetical protein PYS47_06935 [Alicyclobacillus fastidiosus]